MAKLTARTLATLMASGLLLAGCGQGYQATGVSRQTATGVAAQGVSPDQESVYAGDVRRAKYWNEDAELVMAIHTTGLNTTKISASANVFYSQEAYYNGKPCVFVARHYISRPIAQYAEMLDYTRMAGRLKPIGAYTVKSETAWKIAKGIEAQPAPQPTPQPIPTPGMAPMQMPATPSPAIQVKSHFILSSRAFLIQPEAGDPEWHFYANDQLLTINANTKVMSGPTPQLDPKDRLNTGLEVNLQRASAQWLPLVGSSENVITEPPKETD